MRYSIAGILLCLVGVLGSDPNSSVHVFLTSLSHFVFTTSLLLSPHVFETKQDLTFALLLSLFTLVSRRWKGYCILSKARGSEATKEGKYDLLYTYPLLGCAYKLNLNS